MSGFILIGNSALISFNVGDSRTIIISPKTSMHKEKIQVLTRDHTLEDYNEMDRIEGVGGVITYQPGKSKRIAGLTCTRTLGDIEAHAVGVIAEPDLKVWEVTNKKQKLPDENERCCVVCASDGIWTVLDNE